MRDSRKGLNKQFKKGQTRKKSVVLKQDDIVWLSKNTNFDPENIEDWHKVDIGN